MNISIYSDPKDQQKPINQQQIKNITELSTNCNWSVNMPTQSGQYQDGNKKVKENNQLSLNLRQKHIDESQSINRQASTNADKEISEKQQANTENVGILALQKINRTEQQDSNKQNTVRLQSVQKIEYSNSNTLQKVDTYGITQIQTKQQSAKNEQSKHFFMSIKSERSQVALLDQSSDSTLKNNEANKLESDFAHQSQQVRAFCVKNRECKSQNHSGNSSSEQNQTKNLIKDKQTINQQLEVQQSNPIQLEKISEQNSIKTEKITSENDMKQGTQKLPHQHLFITANTEQLVVEQRQDSISTNQAYQSVVISSQQPAKQKKLNLISGNFSLGIDKQNILYEKEQKVISKMGMKVEPLDIKTLSVLTLSSPQGIKSIRPPSPKLSGERKAKPWQKLKKAKPAESQPKQPNESVITNDRALTQSVISRNLSATIQNTSSIQETSSSSIQQRFSIGAKSQIVKPQQMESKVQRVQPTEQQLKKNYPYISSVIQPNKLNETIIIDNKKIMDEQQTQLFKEQQKLQKQTQQIKVQPKTEINPFQAKPNDILVHQQAKTHPLLRHYPIEYKSLSKQQALAEPQELNKQSQNVQIDSKDKQPIVINKDASKMSQSQINALNQKLSEKKSTGSQIINDSSFQLKKSQKNFDIKKRLCQLQMQIQKQKKINQQLEISSTFERKLLLSLLAGLTTGSLSFFLRKDKLGSILLAFATGVSTFIIKK